MASLNGFDANEVEPTTDFDAIPGGKYLAVIAASEVKPTKSGTGSYLELTFEILEGPYKARKLWSRLNLDNESETAVKIARAELSAVCRAVNVLTPQDSFELHNLPLTIKVRCKKRKDTGDIENVISNYERAGAASPSQPPAAKSSVAPWKRG